jgi:hypothetical protein
VQLPDLREFAIRGRRAWRTRPRLSTDLAVAVIFAVALILLGWMLTRPQTPRVSITIGTGAPPTPRTLPSNATSCPAPTGTVTTVKPGADLSAVADRLKAGNTLVLNDGTYKPTKDSGLQAGWEITGINGTAANPIIIEAAHDGGAVIDGSNDGDNILLWLRNSSNVILCGFDVQNSQNQLIRVGGDGSGPAYPDSVSNVTLERMTAHAAGTAHQSDGNGNFSCMAAIYNSLSRNAHILLQDDAVWGQGCRYGFLAYHVNGVTFRRDWAWDTWIPELADWNSDTHAPRAAFGNYGAQNVTWENDIGTGEIPSQEDNNFYDGVFVTSDDPITYPSNNVHFYGDVFYNDCAGWAQDSFSGFNVTVQDVVSDIPSNSACATYQSGTPPAGTGGGDYYDPSDVSVSGTPGNGPTVTNTVMASNKGSGTQGIENNSSTDTPATASNDVFVNNASAVTGANGAIHTHSDFFGNSDTPSLSTGNVATNPRYNTATYGLGAYLLPPHQLQGHGSGRADMGAQITYEYVNGVLTSTPLWPWPMESRILAQTGRSVTYASGGGIWNTLAGVYP